MTQYVLLKRDLYENPRHQGYTGIRDKAGVWTESEATAGDVPIKAKYDPYDRDHYALPLTEAPEFTQACWPELARDHLLAQRDSLRKENAGLRAAIKLWADQIRAQEIDKAPPLELRGVA